MMDTQCRDQYTDGANDDADDGDDAGGGAPPAAGVGGKGAAG